MNEMIRRVAQAQVGGHRKPTQLELIAARCAIAAMRTPTLEMIEAGAEALRAIDSRNDLLDAEVVAGVWRAMWDAALREEP